MTSVAVTLVAILIQLLRSVTSSSPTHGCFRMYQVIVQEAFSCTAECLVNPSAKPSPSTSTGLLLHMGQSLLRSCEALIQMMRFQRWPEEMGRAPCMCWPRWRRPSVALCSTSEHPVSLKGTCRGQQNNTSEIIHIETFSKICNSHTCDYYKLLNL